MTYMSLKACVASILVASSMLFQTANSFAALPTSQNALLSKATLGQGHLNEMTPIKTSTKTSTSLSALLLLDPMLISAAAAATDPSPAAIQQAFTAATFFPQPFWLLLVFIPKSDITKKVMGGMEVVTLCCLLHLFIVGTSIVQPGGTAPLEEFSGVFDPSGHPQQAMMGMMRYPNFVSEEWSHVLTWDLFVGRWIWLDGLRRGIFTSHSVLLCNLIGPPGLLLHWATCAVTGKGLLLGNEAEDVED